MRRLWASVGSIVFFCVAPGTVAGLVPWWITRWRFSAWPLPGPSFRFAGLALIVAGLMPLVASFGRFAWQGLGTPAPVAPPARLIVGGFYRYVRNPMYVGVVLILVGQALLFADGRLLVWAGVFWVATCLFVLLHEEPALARAFGSDYDMYRANVPRWIPRLTPWEPPA